MLRVAWNTPRRHFGEGSTRSAELLFNSLKDLRMNRPKSIDVRLCKVIDDIDLLEDDGLEEPRAGRDWAPRRATPRDVQRRESGARRA